ncbi:MAG TPA: hypothetical protein VE999_17420 [Gemmataceae bacterium]|nr:hypothetical protein [Gemmataceae bacterium]
MVTDRDGAAGQSKDEDDGGARTTAHWLRKAIRARMSASRYPEDREALENIAEMYEQMAEQIPR